MNVDFCTFCYSGDAHRLHQLGQLKKQVESNGYKFDNVIVVHQLCNPMDYKPSNKVVFFDCNFYFDIPMIVDIDTELAGVGINLDIAQYQSPTDDHHSWKNHVVNHVFASWHMTNADYIVFADNDCWMISQPDSWVKRGIDILESNKDIFIVSPNDGEPERKTQTISQQMFLVNVEDFRQADLNQPGYSGNPNDYPEMPEYHAMLEGRMSWYCKSADRYRYVLPSEYRYWHHNKLTEDGYFETDWSKY